MVKLDTLFKKRFISKISDLEIDRYINFFENSWKDNLEHSKKNIKDFPRWSIISGYYAMHDITKLLIAKQFMIKIDFKVHKTTMQILKELIKDKDLVKILKKGYQEFLNLANDLEEAKKERVKVQYYTGTEFLKQQYQKRAEDFHNEILIYVDKIKLLIGKSS